MNHKIYGRFIKRFLDILFAAVLFLLSFWLIGIIAVLVRWKLGSPVLFCQERPGRNQKIFRLYKFRTMTDQRDDSGKLLPDNQRLTKFGLLLMKTSLDELPELFNILRGEMSFIGPRPLLVEYLPYYRGEEHKRHRVRPGLTGWAQVNGRNAASWDKTLSCDVYYMENQSFFLDCKIFFMTIGKVLRQSDITSPGSVKLSQEREKE